jgi:hypothetical protein
MKTLRCECADPGCPCCHGSCYRKATFILYRMDHPRSGVVDTEDETGTPMCPGCADDAWDSGLFTDTTTDEEDDHEDRR